MHEEKWASSVPPHSRGAMLQTHASSVSCLRWQQEMCSPHNLHLKTGWQPLLSALYQMQAVHDSEAHRDICCWGHTLRASSVAPLSGSLVVRIMRMAARMAGIATITKGHLHPMWGPAEAQAFSEFNSEATPPPQLYTMLSVRMAGIAAITGGHLHPVWGAAKAQSALNTLPSSLPSEQKFSCSMWVFMCHWH